MLNIGSLSDNWRSDHAG